MPDKHLTRRELIQVARQQEVTRNEHLVGCDDCRELVSLVRMFDVAGKLHLPDAPIGWIEKAIALATREGVGGRVKSLVTRVIFDSWTIPQPLGVRGEKVETDRRLRIEAGNMVLDLRAEHELKRWAFVAQVRGGEGMTAIIADKKVLQPDSAGLYQWSGSRPPRRLALRNDDLVVELPELSWKKPQSK